MHFYILYIMCTWVIERTVNLIYNKVNSFLNYRIERSETENESMEYTRLLGAIAMKACFRLPSDDEGCKISIGDIKFTM